MTGEEHERQFVDVLVSVLRGVILELSLVFNEQKIAEKDEVGARKAELGCDADRVN